MVIRIRPRRKTFILLITLAIVVLFAGVLWQNRWRLGHTAVTIADPLVRAWAVEQVQAMSDGAYRFDASPIRVDEANHRLSIDSITLTTDSTVNARLPHPHADLTVRFRYCAVTGIDLAALAARRGLHALHAGCDSVVLAVRTLVSPDSSMTRTAEGVDSGNFLRFQGKIDLPKLLPFVAVDSIVFPSVRASFDLLASDGRRTSLAVDSIAVGLDSVRIDPRQEVAKRRPLFSRNIRVRLDRFEGRTKAGERVALEHFTADLENRTGRLDAISYERMAGSRIDSTGSVLLNAQHVALDGVRWRTFLLTGDVAIASLQVDTVVIRMVGPRNPRKYIARTLAVSIEHALQSAGRGIRIDSLGVHAVRSLEVGRRVSDTAVTTLQQLTLTHLDVAANSATWQKPFPIGNVLLAITGVYRHRPAMDLNIGRLVLDAAARTVVVDSLRAAPKGSDSAFEMRNKYRVVRVSVVMPHAVATGIDLPAFLSRGALRAQTISIRGFAVDVMADNSRPDTPGPSDIRRTPQGVLRDAHTEIQVDSLIANGVMTYRERDGDAAKPGVLTFKQIQLYGFNFSTDSTQMSASAPFRLVGDTRLMGAGALHVEWNVPLLSRTFDLAWKGTLGPMDPQAMNGFIVDAVGMRFMGGEFEGAEWHAVVRNGQSQGMLAPRWHGMKVELPGVARNKTGLFGGLARGVAKFAANSFGIRGDNTTIGGKAPLVGSISHQWQNTETLPQFIWNSLRDPLLLILKK